MPLGIVDDVNLCGFMTSFASNCCYRISQSVTIALAPKKINSSLQEALKTLKIIQNEAVTMRTM